MTSPAEQFAALVDRPEGNVDVARAALVYALNEYPELDVGACLARLDALGESARARIDDAGREPFAALDALNEFLFEEEGFAGNTKAYRDPRNSFLNEVLERRLGIPITLSVVYCEVAARAGLPVRGVGFPGHFLVRHDAPQGEIFLDPFNAGRILNDEELQEMLARFAGPEAGLEEAHLRPATARETLARMLRNLKGIYAAGAAQEKLLWVTELLLLLEPDVPEEIRDRGAVLANLQRYREAVPFLLQYLEKRPEAEDAEEVRKTIRFLRRMAAQLN